MKRHKPLKPPGVQTAAVYAVYINALIYLLFVVMLVYGRNAVIPMEDDRPHPPWSWAMLLFGAATTYLYVFLLFCINFYVLRREKLWNRSASAAAIVVSFVFILVWSQALYLFQSGIIEIENPDPRARFGAMMRDLILGGIVVFTSQLMHVNYRRQQMTLENEALKAEYERARYETLKNQIDPHFLFNTFNTLNSIVGKDPQKAQQYIQKLSSIFRYTIQSKDIMTLAEELDFTRNYCDLMLIRYGENLEFRFDIDGKYNAYSVLPFSIQTLVENAVKHNVITGKQKLIVTLSTGKDDSLTVSNPIQPKIDQEAGEGIGLSNLSERYRLKWGKEITIQNDDGIFSVRLPLIPEPVKPLGS